MKSFKVFPFGIDGKNQIANPSHHDLAAKLISQAYSKLSSGNRVFFHDQNGDRLIFFPGTHSTRDWLTNIQFRPLVTPYTRNGYKGRVRLHQGFYLNYLNMQKQVLELANTDLNLILAGHSSGGCYAQIAGVDINYRLGKEVETITFGSPACGNESWAKSARKRIRNTSYGNLLDPVPWVMPWNKHVKPLKIRILFFLNPHHIRNYFD